jgi:hypothetical protein
MIPNPFTVIPEKKTITIPLGATFAGDGDKWLECDSIGGLRFSQSRPGRTCRCSQAGGGVMRDVPHEVLEAA